MKHQKTSPAHSLCLSWQIKVFFAHHFHENSGKVVPLSKGDVDLSSSISPLGKYKGQVSLFY